MISAHLDNLNQKISSICAGCNRQPEEITVVGVTKYTSVELMNEALKAGLLHIAENRVKNAQEKFRQMEISEGVTKHLIGQLQTKKAKKAVQLFEMIQSVDSVKLADEIGKYAASMSKKQAILLQVNVSGEEQKSGCTLNNVEKFVDKIMTLPSVDLKGLMCMAPHVDDELVVRNCFATLKKKFDECHAKYPDRFTVLSMGMSGDYAIAIEEGSTMIRVGSALFKS